MSDTAPGTAAGPGVPTTKAGREYVGWHGHFETGCTCYAAAQVCVIEAEAASAAREELAAQVRGLRRDMVAIAKQRNEARAEIVRLRAALREAQGAFNWLFSEGPLIDTIAAHGEGWGKDPDPEPYDLMVSASRAVDAALAPPVPTDPEP